MKIRNDYVSNSSSSSFICTSDDADKMTIYGYTTSMDLEGYCYDRAWEDVFGWCWGNEILTVNVNFVDDETLQKEFGDSLYHMLPVSAKDDFDEYKRVYADESIPREEKWEKVDGLKKKVVERIYESLKPVWGDESFVEIVAEDYNENGENDEESMRDEFYSHGGLKFSRSFSNH